RGRRVRRARGADAERPDRGPPAGRRAAARAAAPPRVPHRRRRGPAAGRRDRRGGVRRRGSRGHPGRAPAHPGRRGSRPRGARVRLTTRRGPRRVRSPRRASARVRRRLAGAALRSEGWVWAPDRKTRALAVLAGGTTLAVAATEIGRTWRRGRAPLPSETEE